MNIGVICPSEIAFRRFMPALANVNSVEFVGVAVSAPEEWTLSSLTSRKEINGAISIDRDKAQKFVDKYGGQIFDSYKSLIDSSDIDAVYIPLPPALHYRWAKSALEMGKHVMVEKPSTMCAADTADLINAAQKRSLALHENYMFRFHKQLEDIAAIVGSGEIGDVRLYRIAFGFPRRAANDFRYDSSLGGGALIDAGGYTLSYARRLLGESATLRYAQSNYVSGIDVDMYGSAALVNDRGTTAQIAFGMDNEYKCELEVWGSCGTLSTGRVLTAPAGYVPSVVIKKSGVDETRELSPDDTFTKSIEHFVRCVTCADLREQSYSEMLRQAQLVDEFMRMATR